jgi:hypothetical protein
VSGVYAACRLGSHEPAPGAVLTFSRGAAAALSVDADLGAAAGATLPYSSCGVPALWRPYASVYSFVTRHHANLYIYIVTHVADPADSLQQLPDDEQQALLGLCIPARRLQQRLLSDPPQLR